MIDTTQTEHEVSENSTDTTETERTNTEQTLTICPECDGRLAHDHKHGETACVECGFIIDDVADLLDENTRVGAVEASCEFARARLPALAEAVEHEDMTEGLAEIVSALSMSSTKSKLT